MHILILTSTFPPEVRSSANIMFELSESLRKRGHEVTVVTSVPDVAGASENRVNRFFMTEDQNGVTVIRAIAMSIHTLNLPAVFRGAGQIVNSLIYFIAGLRTRNADVIIAYSPPLPSGITSYLIGKFKKVPFVFNLQDLVPQYAIDLGILKNRFLIYLIKKIEHFIYEKARFITVHSRGNRDYLVREGVDEEKVVVIHNWVDTSSVRPMDRHNDFLKKHGLEDKFVVLFAGMLAYAQDLDTIIESAVYLKDHKDIVILIVGDGVEKPRLMEKTESLGLSSVRFVPFVQKDKYPDVVAASDVCLATLRKELHCPVVPSKILGYMSAGRAVIVSLPLDGDAPAIIKDAKCGITVEPGNPESLAQAVVQLYNDREKKDIFGQNGRKYAVEHFDRERCISAYEEVLNRL